MTKKFLLVLSCKSADLDFFIVLMVLYNKLTRQHKTTKWCLLSRENALRLS